MVPGRRRVASGAMRIVVFGATGYTGRLVAERLVAQGARPVLAGRDDERLSELSSSLGGLEIAHADAMRQNSVFDLVESGDVLVSTVGPFVKWGLPAVRAAIAAGATYLDSTGEPPFIRRVFEELGAPARRSGAALLPAMGYDFAPGSYAGALALEDAGGHGGPDRCRLLRARRVAGVDVRGHARVARGRDAVRCVRLSRRTDQDGAHGRARALLHRLRQAPRGCVSRAAPSTSRSRPRTRG